MQSERIPYMDQYFGAWAMHLPTLTAIHERVRGMDLHVHLAGEGPKQAAAAGERGEDEVMCVEGGIACILARGTLMKQVPSLSNGTSTVQLRQAFRKASKDPDCKGILLCIESPGGTVAGIQELCDEVGAAAKKKPVWAFIEDMGASAAYEVASQCSRIFANATALVGSIGTYAVVMDLSGKAALEGVKVHVVKAGAHKGAGIPGTEVTAEQLGELQRVVDGFNEFFLGAVQRGRKLPMKQVQELADGRVHMAADARALGLIDEVKSFDEVFALMQRETKGTRKMDDNTPKQAQPATLAELKAACVGADSNFLVAQMEAGATIEQATRAWMAAQSAELAQVRAEAEQAKKDAEAAAAARPGVEPVTEGGGGKQASAPVNATEQMEEIIAGKVAKGKAHHVAVREACRENPELHAAWVAEHNAAHAEFATRARSAVGSV